VNKDFQLISQNAFYMHLFESIFSHLLFIFFGFDGGTHASWVIRPFLLVLVGLLVIVI